MLAGEPNLWGEEVRVQSGTSRKPALGAGYARQLRANRVDSDCVVRSAVGEAPNMHMNATAD